MLISILLAGLLLGLWHALDLDHLGAMVTFVAKDEPTAGHAMLYGLVWGAGHGLTLLGMAALIVTLDLSLPAGFAHWMEFLVGVMLVALALDTFRKLAAVDVHSHLHRHGRDVAHEHSHVHLNATAHAHDQHHDHAHGSGASLPRILLVGVMHGMAGSAAFMFLLAPALDSAVLMVVYAALFALGAMLGMGLMSSLLAIQLRRSIKHSPHLARRLRVCAATLALSVGLLLMWDTGARELLAAPPPAKYESGTVSG